MRGGLAAVLPPQSWDGKALYDPVQAARARRRREQARIPDGIWHSEKWRLALEMIDEMAGPDGWACLSRPDPQPARRDAPARRPELRLRPLGGRVLRARTPGGIEQEACALLVTYQALRTALAEAASTVPGTDPDRASFAIALNTARDQVIQAAGVIAGTSIDLAGRIGRLVLAALMPARRLRVSPRVVKRAISKYNARGKVDRATYKATIDIAILTAGLTSGDEP